MFLWSIFHYISDFICTVLCSNGNIKSIIIKELVKQTLLNYVNVVTEHRIPDQLMYPFFFW